MTSTFSTLIRDVERLDNRSLDTFIDTILSLRSRRETTHKPNEEVLLLEKINKSLPIEQVKQLRILNQKRIDGAISEQEYSELLTLLEKTEKLNVNRLKHLTTLAHLRNISVRELMSQLGISGLNNG